MPLAVNRSFRRRYGIPPRGDRNAPPSEWGFPLPPAGHPQALTFAHAVLSRAHQSKDFSAKDVARQVAKAKAIIARHKKNTGKKTESGVTPWRAIAWVNAAKPARTGYAAVKPLQNESLTEFRKRVPGAMPAARAKALTETQKRALTAYLRGRAMREAAVPDRTSERLCERYTSNVAFRESAATADAVKNVLLIRSGPGNRGDKHFYTPTCLAEAASSGIFEGAQLYLDHPDQQEERDGVRSVKYLAGWYSDVELREYSDPEHGKTTGLFATLHPAVDNAKCLEIVRTCAEYAKRYPSKAYAGLSINAYGDGEPDTIDGEEWNRVDRITEVDSVDIVTRAGAGGTITPIKEHNRMKTTSTAAKLREGKRRIREARNPLDLTLTVDADKVKSGIKKLAESQRVEVKKLLREVGVNLSDEQDKDLDGKLGLVDGGALDKLIDEATGVSSDDESIEGDLPMDEGDVEEDDMEEGGDEPDGGDEGDGDAVDAMSHDELKNAHKNLLKQHAALKAKVGAKEAATKSLVGAAQRTLRENAAKGICDELKIPDTFRPRLIHELVEFDSAKKMREHAQAFDRAFIRPQIDGAGTVVRESAQRSAKIDFIFDGEN